MNEIYWLTRLDDVKTLIGFIIAFSAFALIFTIGIAIANFDRHYDDEKLKYRMGKKIAIICSIIVFLFFVFSPCTSLYTGLSVNPKGFSKKSNSFDIAPLISYFA